MYKIRDMYFNCVYGQDTRFAMYQYIYLNLHNNTLSSNKQLKYKFYPSCHAN